MTTTAFLVAVDGRRISVDPSQFPHVGRLAHQLGEHWQTSFQGTGGSSSTPSSYATSIRDLLLYLNAQSPPPEDIRFLDVVALDGWVDSMRQRLSRETTRARATHMRVLLDNVDPSLLHESLTDGRVLRWRPDVERGGTPLSDLTPGQWAALRKVVKRAVFDTTMRIGAARAVARAGAHPDEHPDGWRSQPHVFWAILNNAFDLDAFTAANARRPWPDWMLPFRPKVRYGRTGLAYVADRISEHLFPTMLDMAGFWPAMAATTGLPPESVGDLEVGWFDTPAGGDLTILRYRKQRRGAPTTPLLLLAKPRFSAQRLRDTYTDLTAPLRTRTTESHASRLWLFAVATSGGQIDVRVPTLATRHFTRWIHQSGLLDADHIAAVSHARAERRQDAARRNGRAPTTHLRPLEPWTGPIDPRRIRKTDKARRIVIGGLAAANDHTVRVLIAHYTNSDLVRVRSALLINDIADTLVAFANGPRPATVVASDAAEEALDSRPASAALADLLGITEPQLHDILRGRHNIGTVACIDPEASPYDEPGRFCRRAGSELCLSCPQAVVLRDHVPTLWAEVERLERIAATMTGDDFGVVHGEHHRLLLDLLSCFDRDGVGAYRAHGTIPSRPGAVPAPGRLQRRRARR